MIERQHAKLGPSGWKKWSTCPGSVALEAHFPNETSEFAAEGTAMHYVREQCLLTGKDVHEFVGDEVKADGFTFEVTNEWVNWIQPGVDRLREEGGELYVEKRVSLEAWVEGEFGTVDALVILPDLIIVDDFKGGRGVVVAAERNGQAMQYALGAWENIARHKTKATDFLIRIDQPRVPGGGSEWRCTLDELLRFAENEYVPAAEAAKQEDAPLVPSPDACQFCTAASNAACPALHSYCAEMFGIDIDNTDLAEVPAMPDIDQLTPEKRSYIIKHQKMLSKWLQSIHGLQLSEALAGHETPGFKAVETTGDRQWVDPEEAEKYWTKRLPKKDCYTQKLKSPAQIERVAGTRVWSAAQDMIHRPPGKPALVPETDPRPALIPVVDLLGDLDDEPETVTEELDDLI